MHPSVLTSFDRAVHMVLGFIMDPVKAGLHSQLGQKAVLGRVAV